ncbi:MAG: PAS domain S-box protein [Terriglobales bacterium]
MATIAGIALACALVLVALFVISHDLLRRRYARAAHEESSEQPEAAARDRSAELVKEAVLESEARLHGIIESAMDAIITVDEQQKIVLFNPAAEQMFHCLAAKALGHPLDQFIPQRLRSAHTQYVRQFGETKMTRRQMANLGSISGLRASGQEFPIEASISQVRVGGRTLFTAIVRDITERKTAEEALRSRGARFRSLIENSADGITVVNAEGKIVYASPPAEQMLGYRPGEMVGDSILDLVHPDDRERYLEVRRMTLESSRPAPARFRMRHKNGSWRIIESIRSNQLDNADVRGVVVNSRDVTELVRAEDTLRRQAALFEQTYDAVFVWDWKGPITFWNRAAERLYGYSRAEAVGKSPHDLLQTKTLGSTAPFLSALEHDGNWEGELEHTTGEGRRMTVDSRMALVRDGEHAYVLEITRDITERKRAEEEIQLLNRDLERRVAQRTAELETAVKELESFSYSVAHDLRAPLRTLDGFSDAVLEDYGPQLPEQAREYLQTIRRGAQRMGDLIDDLLAFSRLSRQPLARQPVNMEALVRGVLEELGPERNGRKIEFLDGALPATQGDPALLKQVWMNLLSNAIKYSRNTEPTRIEIGALAEAQRNVYFVRDNGAGFDMKYAGKLFGVFQRLHRADEFEGTGIGLATVQRIVHRHGGRVWAEAQPDQGATFYFTLEGEQ